LKDVNVNWRNHRWSFDTDYVERESAPILSALIEQFGMTFDDTYAYIFHGKAKQYIFRFQHLNGTRWNYRIPTERPKDPFQRKLTVDGIPK